MSVVSDPTILELISSCPMAGVFRDGLLEGKTAFVTGGGSGIGLGMAKRFAEHGAKVMLTGRRKDVLENARAEIEAAGGIAGTAPLDVRDYAAQESALKRTRDEFGSIDIVLAAAAGNFPAPVLGMSANGFKAVIDIDLLGTFNTMRAAHQFLRKPGASLLAVSAAHATSPIPFQSHVGAAKAAIEILMKTIALEWSAEGIRANCITPGPTADTEGMRRLAPTPELENDVKSTAPLHRFGTRDELADLALYLCTDAAAYFTGATFFCDGGTSLLKSGTLMGEVWKNHLNSRSSRD
jgi:NAD(P)-dependent dehydrogenase (short-subunit alcohol dehydrogenase family)